MSVGSNCSEDLMRMSLIVVTKQRYLIATKARLHVTPTLGHRNVRGFRCRRGVNVGAPRFPPTNRQNSICASSFNLLQPQANQRIITLPASRVLINTNKQHTKCLTKRARRTSARAPYVDRIYSPRRASNSSSRRTSRRKKAHTY